MASSKLRVQTLHVLEFDLVLRIRNNNLWKTPRIPVQWVCGFEGNTLDILQNPLAYEATCVLVWKTGSTSITRNRTRINCNKIGSDLVIIHMPLPAYSARHSIVDSTASHKGSNENAVSHPARRIRAPRACRETLHEKLPFERFAASRHEAGRAMQLIAPTRASP